MPSNWSRRCANVWRMGPSHRSSSIDFEQRLFSSGLRKGDIEQVLGESFAACIPNHYGLVREAIDRGIPLEEVKPGNKITLQLKKLILPSTTVKAPAQPAASGRKLKFAFARG